MCLRFASRMQIRRWFAAGGGRVADCWRQRWQLVNTTAKPGGRTRVKVSPHSLKYGIRSGQQQEGRSGSRTQGGRRRWVCLWFGNCIQLCFVCLERGHEHGMTVARPQQKPKFVLGSCVGGRESWRLQASPCLVVVLQDFCAACQCHVHWPAATMPSKQVLYTHLHLMF